MSGTGKITLDSVDTVGSGNTITGLLILSNSNPLWSGGIEFLRGTVRATAATALGTGPITAPAGRIQFNAAAGTIYNLPATQTITVDAPSGVFEMSADASGSLVTDLEVNVFGQVTLGSAANANNALRLLQNADNFSIIVLKGGVVLGNNASISTSGSATRDTVIDTVGISETLVGSVLSINDDQGGWNQTNRTLAINVASTYTGGTNLAGGVLSLGNVNAIGNGPLTVTGGSTLRAGIDLAAGAAGPFANDVSLNANLTVDGTNNLTMSGTLTGTVGDVNRTLTNNLTTGNLILTGPINLAPAAGNTTARTQTFSGTADTTIDGIINSGNAFANNVQKSGAGTLFLTNANLHTGNTQVSGGALRISNPQALGATSGGTSVDGNTATGALELVNNITVTGETLTMGGRQGVAVDSAHLRNVSGNNEWAGNIDFTTGGSAYNIESAGGNLTISGQISGATTTGVRNLSFAGSSSGTVSGAIVDGSATVNVSKNGTGTWNLSGPNTYSGNTAVNDGQLNFTTVAAGASAQSLGAGTTVTLGSAGTSSGILNYTGATAATLDKNITALGNGTDTVSNNSVTGALTLSGTITKNGTTLTLAGGTNGLNVTGQIVGGSPNSDLVVTGAVNLGTGDHTYVGPTTVNASSNLTVGGQLSGSTGVTVNNAGTLLLNTVSNNSIAAGIAPVLLAGGTIAIDDTRSVNTQSFGQLTLSANSALNFGTGDTNVFSFGSLDAATRSALVAGTTMLTISGWTGTLYNPAETSDHGPASQDRLLFTSDPGFGNGNTISGINFTGFGQGMQIDFGGGQYEIVPVPEPATTALIGSVALCALIGYRERRRFTGKRLARK